MNQVTTAVVLLIRDKKVLILRRGPTAPWMPLKWNLPGGVAEPGETPEEAARRECFEETGFRPDKLESLDSFGTVWGPFYAFTAEPPVDFVPQLCSESIDCTDVSLEQAWSVLHPYHLEFVPHVKELIWSALGGK